MNERDSAPFEDEVDNGFEALDELGKLLGDEGVAIAILDRLLHRVKSVQMEDESYRMKHRQRVFD